MTKPRLLDLFCGAGGAAMGYYRAGFEVVGVDIKPQKSYPFPFILGDALDVMARMLKGEKFLASDGKWYGIEDFDAIHASPPCQSYSTLARLNKARFNTGSKYPRMISATREIINRFGVPYVIENVQGASDLQTQFILCGHSLGLEKIARHRHFECNILIPRLACTHRGKDIIGIYGEKPDGRWIGSLKYKRTFIASSIDEARSAMGIDWMDWDEIREAIPPAYTEYIGGYLLKAIQP